MATKQQVKRAAKKVAGKVAGKRVARSAKKGFARIAALVEQSAQVQATAEDLARVKAQIADLADRSEDVSLTAAGVRRSVEEIGKQVAAMNDPRQKQLHRRVLVLVYDAEGTRVSNAVHDLAKTDSLSLTVCGAGVSASITANDR